MKQPASITLLFLALSVGACQTIPSEDAALCSRIAQFANATSDSATHQVELTMDWGGQFAEKQGDEFVMSQKVCSHFGYPAGDTFCDYLIQHSSTEFPDANVNSVMVCLGAGKPTRMVYDLEYGKSVLWSHVAHGVHPGILVGVDYSTGTRSAPPSLKILARKAH